MLASAASGIRAEAAGERWISKAGLAATKLVGPRIDNERPWAAPLGDGRALHSPIPSATWQPPGVSREAHGFASPPYGRFALSRRPSVGIRAGQPNLPPKPTPKLPAPFAGQV